MSKTTKPIGSPNGGACVDPNHFSNAKQATDQGRTGHDARSATSSPRTITAGGNTADGNVKSSAKPNVGSVYDGGITVRTIQPGPNSPVEKYGK